MTYMGVRYARRHPETGEKPRFSKARLGFSNLLRMGTGD
ncbi:hypothetical protein HMPREF1531_01561 [Propionibacterium sp. oral taxon 192 str. F0372]|nr:hypothetical protein HMPREF1531_01561 [Propionibacterium sp. oral taxon 192 str. F0372]